MEKKVGFLVNPIAGLGGKVGLKGTDGRAGDAVRLGAKPAAEERALEFLRSFDRVGCLFITCAKRMGGNALKKAGIGHKVVYSYKGESTADDTRKACKILVDAGSDIIVFCGGDGTAADIYEAVGDTVPVMGIPAGVKMYSSVFAVTPEAGGKLLSDYLRGDARLIDTEIMDVDEEAYRRDNLKAKLLGHMKTPYKPSLVQLHKQVFSGSEERSKKGIAKFISQLMLDSSAYIMGPGSTVKAVMHEVGVKGTLLGVDAVRDGRLILKDANEKQLLDFLKKEKKVKIIVSPIGAQGFIFGRGNQQISAEVIRKVGVENIIVVATHLKLESTPRLYVDTGSEELDKRLSGYRQVICDYHMAARKRVHSMRDFI
ncbi:MAG: ATP-NAD kinase family protein [Candidatus Altiarchaeota archaeon]